MSDLIKHLPQTPAHRNKEAAALSERIAKAQSETYDDTWRLFPSITFNVHLAAENHKPEVIQGVTDCLKAGKEFILFSDFDNYTIFIPESRMAVQFIQGQEVGRDVTQDDRNWISRIKAAMITYKNFFINAQPTEVLQLREEDR